MQPQRGAIGDVEYRVPRDLRRTPTAPRRVLVIGSCLTADWTGFIPLLAPEWDADFVLVNHLTRATDKLPPHGADYAFRVVQLPLRSVIPERLYWRLDTPDMARTAFDHACAAVTHMLDAFVDGSAPPTFVLNFLVPQQNLLGRLQPRYDLANPTHFIERLNEHLAVEVDKRRGAYLVDADAIAATLGRRHVQDDVVWMTSHGAAFADADLVFDGERLESPTPVSQLYPSKVWEFAQMLWAEIEAAWRTLTGVDAVKMVLVDLDDTLWRGVYAERGTTHLEGWPMGLAEALLALRRRGVILGIVSRNDDAFVATAWDDIFEGKLRLEDFAVRRIDGRPKPENIAELLSCTGLLPSSVVFIDDNPVERAAVENAFPEIRTLGAEPYLLRRILLWSPETQVAEITSEAVRRSDMMTAQVARETARRLAPRHEFLAGLRLRVTAAAISAADDWRLPRIIELINRSNQFNTTGERWTEAQAAAFLASGRQFHAVTVEDRFTHYGLAGVLAVEGDHVRQLVLSCRVLGLDIELAAAALLRPVGDPRPLTAALVETAANASCRDTWRRCGMRFDGEVWRLDAGGVAMPAHVLVRANAELAAG